MLPISAPDAPLNVGVAFGGVSPEHEVSVISALQAAAALDRSRYRPVPIYVAKDGTWYTGGKTLLDPARYTDLDAVRADAMPVAVDTAVHGKLALVEMTDGGWWSGPPYRVVVDVVFLALHGGDGESGGLQGLCETLNVPYTGSGISGSALGMDKVISKWICRDQGIPIVDFAALRESDWGYQEEAWLDRLEEQFTYPVIVKPARLGSSIGITKADDRAALDTAIEEAFRYDDKVVVERAVPNLRELNCSILGDADEAIASVLEEPVRTTGEALLTFQEKYMRGEQGAGGTKGPRVRRGAKAAGGSAGMASLDRIIPAPLDDAKTQEVRDLAVRIFQAFECGGVARIDFLMDDATGEVFFNEINTIPGSFSFYLWDPPTDAPVPQRIPFDELTHRMIERARARHRAKNGRVRSYDVNLLAARSISGLKGSKG